MVERPLARRDVIVEGVDDGVVIYVSDTHRAHALDAVAASVWAACDGIRTSEDIGRDLQYGPAAIETTLARLADSELLVPISQLEDDRSGGLSRRALLRRGGAAGAAMTLGTGTILSVDVPSAQAALSGLQTLNLYATPGTPCQTGLTANQRGTVQVTISAVAGNPGLNKLTLTVALFAYTAGLPPVVFQISINCGASLGTITTNSTGAGGPVTVSTNVPSNQVSVVTVVPPGVNPIGFTINTKATPSFIA